jgi:soluble lytic murein transglycosylase-like protein
MFARLFFKEKLLIRTTLIIGSFVVGTLLSLFGIFSGINKETAQVPIAKAIQIVEDKYSTNTRVQQWVHYYSKVDSTPLNNVHGRNFYTHPIVQRLLKQGIPIERAEIYAEIPEIESKWKNHVISSKGAVGLWQVMPNTARQYHFGIPDLSDPVTATNCACQYIKYLDSLFSGDVASVLFSYNGGENNTLKLFKKYKTRDPWLIPFPSPETQDFAPKVLAAYLRMKEY